MEHAVEEVLAGGFDPLEDLAGHGLGVAVVVGACCGHLDHGEAADDVGVEVELDAGDGEVSIGASDWMP